MDARCKSEPVSWLRLERYHLGEADAAERAAVEGHLAGCAVCAACLASIASEDAVALPPLPAVLVPRRRPAARATAVLGGLALAAATLLAVGTAWRPGRSPAVPGTPGVKGGELAFTLVRDDDERIAGPGGVYRDGDRFKAVVTCPPGLAATFDLVVFDEGGASYPLGPGQRLACGNDVPLAGALRLTGTGEETVCLVWSSAGAPDRRSTSARALGDEASCKRLTGATP